MMQSMRDNMKVIIWVTAIIFLVGFGVLQLGGVLNPETTAGPAGVIAKINGDAIRYEEFMGMYQNALNQIRQTREVKEGEDSYVREQAWQQMIQSKLIEQEVRRRGIRVTPEEIKIAIRFAPPEFILRAPGFQTNGQFDYRKYLAELDNPNSPVPWAEVEQYVAMTLPQQKLQQEIASTAKVSESDVRDRFRLLNEQVAARYLFFPIDSFPIDTSRIGGADIETYYKSHPEEFTGPPEVKLQVALVPRKPMEPDFSVARERMQGIREQVLAQPDSFPRYARTYSEAGSSVSGGDGADVQYMQLRPSYQAALKPLQPGQISDVVREERSVHLFRLDKRWMDPKTNQMMVHYHEIAFRVEPGAEAIRQTRKAIQELVKDARKNGLAKAATRAGYATTETDFFREGNSRNQVFESFPEIERWCFTAKPGSISHPVPTENGWFLYEIVERQPAGLRPLAQVRLFVRERLIYSLQVARAENAATQAKAAIVPGANEAAIAKQLHGVTGTVTEVKRNGYLGALGVEPRIVGGLFGTSVGAWSPPLSGNRGALVGLVTEHTRPNEDQYRTQAPEIRNNLLQERRQVRFTEWMQSLRKNAKIEDYREKFFDA